jgi:ribonucleotide reductase alpha subunit
MRDERGEVTETPEEMCWRVAQSIAGGEARYGRSPAAVHEVAEAFYDMMVDAFFVPNSPTLMNAGKGNGLQYSACYVLPVGDSMGEIFDSVKAAAIIHQSGGGCVAGDARVWTTFCGLEPIEVLVNRATADGRAGEQDGAGVRYDVSDLDIRTVSMDPATGQTGLRRVTHVWRFDVPAEQQVVVETREGTRVQTSAWHPFMVLRPAGLTEVRADAVAPGDVILGPERPDDYWPYDKPRRAGQLEIDESLGWLVGFTLGDGSFGYVPALRQYRLRWFSGERDVLDRVRSVLARQDIHVSLQRDRRGLWSVSTLTQRFVMDMLEACGLEKIGPKDDRVRVPEVIAKSPLSVVRAFLAGLVDSDGYVAPDGSPSYATASREMAEDLAGLVSLLGYQPSVSAKPPRGRRKRTIYSVQLCTLPQVNALRADLVPFAASEHRITRLHSATRKQTALRLPFRPWRDRLKALGLVSVRGREGRRGPFAAELNRWSCNVGGRCRRDDLARIAGLVGSRDAQLGALLDRVATRGLEVEAVTRARQPKAYYDLTVEDWNTYAAGTHGMTMVHNTGFAFSRLRPKDDVVSSTRGRASGPVSFLRVFNAATEAVKQGGCVAPDTRVATSRGIVEIRELGPATAAAATWHPHTRPLLVATDEGPRQSDEFYNNGVALVRRIRTAHGYAIRATLEHRLRVIDERGQYVWKTLEDLKVGDWVALQKNTYLPVDDFRFPRFEAAPHPNATPVRLPETVSGELGEFIGYFVGDGAVSRNRRGTARLILSVCRAEPDVAAHLLGVADRLFGLRPVRQQKDGDGSENYYFNATTLVAWLRAVGVDRPSALEVRLPELAFTTGREFACGVLRGLFTADGSTSKEGYVSLASTSRGLVEDVQQLLLALGIPSAISEVSKRSGAFGRNPLFRLRIITVEGRRAFSESIGFFSSRKTARQAAGRNKAWEFNDVIPFQGALLARLYDGPGRGSGRGRGPRGADRPLYRALQHYLPRVAAPRHLTRSRLRQLAERHPAIGSDPMIQWFLGNDQFYDQVVKIEEGESLTLDLSVPSNHTYVANGFVSHNTRRGANMGILRVDHPDILEFIDCKLDGGITNFNISVAVTDTFMEALAQGSEYDLVNPRTRGVVGRLSAREVFERIVRSAWRTGDPGMVFIDRINASPANPTPEIGVVEATNPCVTGDTLVAVPEGWRRADRIRPGDVISTVKGPRPVERVEVNQDTPVFRVDFSDGGSLRVTAAHQFYMSRGDDTFIPMRLDRCQVGEEVHTLHGDIAGGAKILRIKPAGVETTYDLYEPETDTWITEGYVSRGCGEQPLLPNEACNLGSLNVSKFARQGADGEWTIDWDEMERVVRLAVRFLDDVIEMNPYPLPEIDQTVKSNRRIGLGIMGWADLLFIMGIPYDSQEAIELADRLMAFVKEKSHDQCSKLAEERGPFPNWSRSIYRDIRPMRNSTVTTIAPTGTISMIAGCSSGVEPIFALAFQHRVKQPDGERVLTFVNETFEKIAKIRGFYSDALMEEIVKRGALHGIPGLPEEAGRVFKTSHEIGFEWHVRHQAAFQRHTDNGVSKTINLPNDATEDDVASAYRLAWDLGCLGITVFRDGCKGEQVLHVGVKDTTQSVPSAPRTVVKPRPHSLSGRTYRAETPIGTAFITVNETEDHEPFEVFVQVGKGGSDTMAVAEALGRLISLTLRLPSVMSPQRRLEEVISQLSRIGGAQPLGFGKGKVLSLPDALARTLAEHTGQLKHVSEAPLAARAGDSRRIGDLCKECGQATFVYEEGCKKCLSCGYNEC